MKNQKGITLIELLAGLAILLIISSLLYGVLIGLNKNYSRLSAKAELSQEANIILATIKNYHEKESLHAADGSYKISYDSAAKKAYIGKTTADIPLQKESLQVELVLNETAFSGEMKINSVVSLKVSIKLINRRGQTYEIDTIIKRY